VAHNQTCRTMWCCHQKYTSPLSLATHPSALFVLPRLKEGLESSSFEPLLAQSMSGNHRRSPVPVSVTDVGKIDFHVKEGQTAFHATAGEIGAASPQSLGPAIRPKRREQPWKPPTQRRMAKETIRSIPSWANCVTMLKNMTQHSYSAPS
jgi:hypothetical protein